MNRSYSKIRHIQEANLMLERRLLNEQVTGDTTPVAVGGGGGEATFTMNGVTMPIYMEGQQRNLTYLEQVNKAYGNSKQTTDGSLIGNISYGEPFPIDYANKDFTVAVVLSKPTKDEEWVKEGNSRNNFYYRVDCDIIGDATDLQAEDTKGYNSVTGAPKYKTYRRLELNETNKTMLKRYCRALFGVKTDKNKTIAKFDWTVPEYD